MPLFMIPYSKIFTGNIPHREVYNYIQAMAKGWRQAPAGAQKAADTEPPGPWQDFALALAAQIGPDRVAANATLEAAIGNYASGYAMQIA